MRPMMKVQQESPMRIPAESRKAPWFTRIRSGMAMQKATGTSKRRRTGRKLKTVSAFCSGRSLPGSGSSFTVFPMYEGNVRVALYHTHEKSYVNVGAQQKRGALLRVIRIRRLCRLFFLCAILRRFLFRFFDRCGFRRSFCYRYCRSIGCFF